MSWQIFLILAAAILVGGTIVALALMLRSARRGRDNALDQVEMWKGRYQEALAAIRRMNDLLKAKELSDDEALAELLGHIDSWDPSDPSGIDPIDRTR